MNIDVKIDELVRSVRNAFLEEYPLDSEASSGITRTSGALQDDEVERAIISANAELVLALERFINPSSATSGDNTRTVPAEKYTYDMTGSARRLAGKAPLFAAYFHDAMKELALVEIFHNIDTGIEGRHSETAAATIREIQDLCFRKTPPTTGNYENDNDQA